MEMTREKLLRAYPEMPKSTALRLEHTLEKLQSGAYEKSAQGAPKRIGFVMALAIVLLAAAIGTAACARLGVFDFMSRSGGRTGVLPGAQELVQTDLAALETEHARLAVTEAVYDGATLRLVYSITAKGIDAPLTEDDLSDGDSAFYQALRADGMYPMCDWFRMNGEEYTMTAGTAGEQIPGGENGEMLGYLDIQLASEGIVPEGDFTAELPFVCENGEWKYVEFTVKSAAQAQPLASLHAGKAEAEILAASVSPVRATTTLRVTMDSDATREETLFVFSDWKDAALVDAEGSALSDRENMQINRETDDTLELSFTFLPTGAEEVYLAPMTVDADDNWFVDMTRALKLK